MHQLTATEIKKLREELLELQNGLCLISGKPTQRPVLDHQHKKGLGGTGLCRGVIDANINVFLGKIENNCKRYGISLEELPKILRNIADYLEKPHLPYIHPSEKPKKEKLMKSSYNRLASAIKKTGDEKDIKKLPEYTGNITKVLTALAEKYEIKLESK